MVGEKHRGACMLEGVGGFCQRGALRLWLRGVRIGFAWSYRAAVSRRWMCLVI